MSDPISGYCRFCGATVALYMGKCVGHYDDQGPCYGSLMTPRHSAAPDREQTQEGNK